jgi:hypothetical protein
MAKAVVVDACRDGFAGEQLTEFDLLGSLRKGRGATSTKAPGAKGSTVFFSSCMPGEVSFEDAKKPIRGGIFMHFFGQALIGHADFDGGSHDGLVTASEAIAYASRRTRDHVRSCIDTMKTPWADCDSDSDISLATLSVDAKKRMMEVYGTERIEGLKGVKRQQAESMIDNAFGLLASGNRPLTIRFASAAIDMDAGYAIARRMRSLMYQLSGNDEPSRARHFYRLAIDDMRAVEGSLRVKLIKDQKIQADPRPDVAVSAADLVLIDDIITTDGIDWLHVNAYRRSNDDPLTPSQPVDGYLRLTEIADPESNAAQLAEFYRSLNQPNPRWAIRIAALLGSLAALPNAKRPEPAQKPEAASPIGTWDVIVDGKSKGTVTLKPDGTFEDSSKQFYYYSNADWQKIVQKNEASYREAKQNVTQRLTHFIAKWEKTNNGSITLTRGHEIKVIFHDRNHFHHTSEKYSWVFELTGQATEITTLKCEERKNELTVESNYLPAPKAAQSVTKETIMLRLKRSSP